MKSKGFTLIELMIVVAIIAIIAAIAIPNLLRSRMAANEVAAVAACKAFCTAESIYRRTDYNKDGVLEYAQSLSGNNSLVENVAGAGDLVLVDKAFANAEGWPVDCALTPKAIGPKDGYVFRVTQMNKSVTPFLNWKDSTGHLTLGFGLNAFPNQYDGTGRNIFSVSNAGTIYQKDLGVSITPNFNEYDVNSTWIVSE